MERSAPKTAKIQAGGFPKDCNMFRASQSQSPSLAVVHFVPNVYRRTRCLKYTHKNEPRAITRIGLLTFTGKTRNLANIAVSYERAGSAPVNNTKPSQYMAVFIRSKKKTSAVRTTTWMWPFIMRGPALCCRTTLLHCSAPMHVRIHIHFYLYTNY